MTKSTVHSQGTAHHRSVGSSGASGLVTLGAILVIGPVVLVALGALMLIAFVLAVAIALMAAAVALAMHLIRRRPPPLDPAMAY